MFVVLKVAVRSMQYARRTSIESCRMIAQMLAPASSLDAHELHPFITDERVENSDRIATASYAGEYGIRQALFAFQDLRPCFIANHTMKIAHHERIRMCAKRGTEQVM